MVLSEGLQALLVALLVVVTFGFLFGLARGTWSQKRETVARFIFGILFFSACALLTRNTRLGVAGRPQAGSPVLVEASGADVRK